MTAARSAVALAVALLLAVDLLPAAVCGAVAQDPVRIGSSLGHAAIESVRAHLERALPDAEFTIEFLDTAEWSARYPDGLHVDVVCGVDALLCEIAASRGKLAQQQLPRSFCTDPGGRYYSPWAFGWVFALSVARDGSSGEPLEPLEPPESLDHLSLPIYDDAIGVCGPRAAPSLWAGWLRQLSVRGIGEEESFAWLGGLDARVQSYRPTVGEVAFEFANRKHRVAVLPSDVAVRARRQMGGQNVALWVTSEGMSLNPLALALVANSPRRERARRVFDALRDPELDRVMRDAHELFTADTTTYGGDLGLLFERRVPYAPIEPAAALAILERWDENVSGRGRGYARIGLILDVVFTVLFFIAAWWIFRMIGDEKSSEEAAA